MKTGENLPPSYYGVTEPYLQMISADDGLALEETDGAEILADAGSLFRVIHVDFDLDRAIAPATKAASVVVYKIEKKGTLEQIFTGSLGIDAREFCLTQSQIIGFVRKYPGWLAMVDGLGTLFFYESAGRLMIAKTIAYAEDNIWITRHEFIDREVCPARYRIVAPKRAL